MKRKIIIDVISWLIAILFINVGLSKLLDLHTFRIQLSESPLLGNHVSLIALPLPLTEITVAILLIAPSARKIGMVVSFALMIIFTGYTIYLLEFAHHIPCSCGGILKGMSWTMHLYFNSFITILAGVAIWLLKRERKMFIKGGTTSWA